MPTILQRIANGEPSAIRDCLAEYGDLVWRLALRYLRVPEEAEDATQEVFVALWLTARRFDPAKGSEPAWVATIAHRRLTDYARSPGARRPVSSDGMPAPASPPDALKVNGWTAQDDAIVRALRELTPDEREALWLSIVAGMSHTQIAEVLDLPAGTVKTRIRRAIRRLRETVLGSAELTGKGV